MKFQKCLLLLWRCEKIPFIAPTQALPRQGGGNLFEIFNVFTLSPGGRGQGEGAASQFFTPSLQKRGSNRLPPFAKGGGGDFSTRRMNCLRFSNAKLTFLTKWETRSLNCSRRPSRHSSDWVRAVLRSDFYRDSVLTPDHLPCLAQGLLRLVHNFLDQFFYRR